ncbi:hypothetical protein amyaer_2856 [Microcystis aeruginosa NIES-2481]|nr:hypothetical protein amyaer_2856 [Microcystis aeruginosa NIES-2481]
MVTLERSQILSGALTKSNAAFDRYRCSQECNLRSFWVR